MSDWHPNGLDGLGLQGVDGEYYKIEPIKTPDNPSEVWLLKIEANDEKGTVTELGRFDDLGSAKLHAEQDYAEKFVTPGDFDPSELLGKPDE
ncbi:hypothetical protein [Mycobacterium sp. 852002-10029_SCH5224772]|uniref:hypothetical protein n=1 Tax=Mycobacterium sp. 852002-10029_SCH5224772 TaxID=1834083 RepID=UPI0007FB9F59|nr:hypothetical protein [Mycobacterium sp. 852002-10029_SCH5224772]OBF05343.1 hypothetical protein A5775_24325 [Mycobacterium sp. 852002-10029_SCH5224772]